MSTSTSNSLIRKSPEPPTDHKDDVPQPHTKRSKVNDDISPSSTHQPCRPSTLERWQKEFPWLKWEMKGNIYIFKCTWCESAKNAGHTTIVNNFTTGTTNGQHSSLVFHAGMDDHRLAQKLFLGQTVESQKSQTQPTSSGLDKYFKSNKLTLAYEIMLPIFRNIYFLSRELMPLHKASKLHDLASLHGIELTDHYRNNHAAREILFSINDVIDQDSQISLQKSNFVGIMLDSSTDIAGNVNLIVSVKFFDRVRQSAQEKFLSIEKLGGKDAIAIFKQLKGILETKGIYKKISAISTDGEAAMCSLENGVCGLITKENSNLIAVHCVAHRLVLASKDLSQSNIKFRAMNNLIHGICAFFARSPKKMDILLKEEIILNEDQLKLFTPLDVRWLSHYPAIKRIIKIYPALINALQEMMDEYPNAGAYLIQFTKFRVIGLLHAFADLLHTLYNLNLLLQKRDLRINELIMGIASTRAGIEAVSTNQNCPYFGEFLSSFDPAEKTLYKEVKVLYDVGMNEDLADIRATIVEACSTAQKHLDRRFNNLKVLNQMQVFECAKIRNLDTDQLIKYGNEEVLNLMNILNSQYLNKENPLNKEETLADWTTIKFLIRGDWIHYDDEKVEASVIIHPTLTKMSLIYEYMRVIPLTTVDCERHFSRMNLIKTTLRNQLEPDTLSAHMNVSLNGSGIENFDFRKAFDIWQKAKPRKYI
jgi:hypothetical protein